MRVAIYSIDRAGPGHVSVMARPRGGDWLVNEMEALREASLDTVVSLPTPSEVQELEPSTSAV